ncbi:MAG: hypothetical protein ACLPX7_19445 [Xanthobacteraceae bacterium]
MCGSAANILVRDIHSGTIIDCSRCGDFSVSRVAEADFLPLKDLKQRALASHLIRKLQGASRPTLTSDFFASLSQRALPTPAEASDNLLLWLAEIADGSPGKQIGIDYSDPNIQGLIGVIDDDDVRWVGAALKSQGLVDAANTAGMQLSRLTPRGWLRVEELKRAHISSRFAFFARQFRNSDLDSVFEQCLRPAVAQTGYELRPVTQRAGLVDAIIEDEIRRCRFLIADLSDDNAGAYWEAGFAEGLGKPVIYVCRAREGGELKKTHFDANHRHTVRWDLSALDQTAKELKAVIRNTLLGDANQDD